jgi:Leucine-rich repeat (LRR) protein
MLNTLKKFKKLKSIEFSQNYIISLLQIAKLENLTTLKSLTIEAKGNPIFSCTFLK